MLVLPPRPRAGAVPLSPDPPPTSPVAVGRATPADDLLEVSDLVVRVDPEHLERLPVRRADVVRSFEAAGDRRGASIVRRLPVDAAGVLDAQAVDALLLRTHAELQRLSVELQVADRVAEVLVPLLQAVGSAGGRASVVDVGCGLGHVVRTLAARGDLPGSPTLVGCDLVGSLVAAAQRLADDDALPCRFLHADALRLDLRPSVFLSTGVLHHFRRDDLVRFFERQHAAGAQALVHLDVAPTSLTGIGAWLFHRARMREPLARHDGVVSARRAHPDHVLVEALRRGAPTMVPVVVDGRGARCTVLRVLRSVLALRPERVDAFLAGLGSARDRVQVHW